MESKHHEYKSIPFQCKRDLVKTMAVGAALSLMKPIIEEQEEEDENEKKKKRNDALEVLESCRKLSLNFKSDHSKPFFKLNEVQVLNCNLRKNLVIFLGVNANLTLSVGKVKEMFEDENNVKHIIIQYLDDFGYDSHYDAHLVRLTERYDILIDGDDFNLEKIRAGTILKSFDGLNYLMTN